MGKRKMDYDEVKGAVLVDDDNVEPEEPWYQLAGWWEGLSDDEIDERVWSIANPGVWVVVPPGFLSRKAFKIFEAGEERESAWEIYMELTRRSGYSTNHAQQAWEGARAFRAKGEEG